MAVRYHSFMHAIDASVQQMSTQFARMRALASGPQEQLWLTISNVSAWCPAEHLDHLTKASSSIFRRLLDGGAAPPRHAINLIGRLVLTLGWIPRGRGKTPERLSGTRANCAALLASIDEMESLARQLDPGALTPVRTPVVPHPKFGGLTPAQALRFVAIHNEHHLRIIMDMERSASQKH